MLIINNRKLGISLAILFLITIILIPYGIKTTQADGISSRFFAYFVMGVCFILSVIFTFTEKTKTYEIDLSMWKILISGVVYYVLLMFVGFAFSTFLFSLVLSHQWDITNRKQIIILAFLIPLVFYIIFTVFMNIQLPIGWIFKM